MQPTPQMALQIRVSRMLGHGFVLTLVGVGGLGYLIAVALGLRARHLIKTSGGEVGGIKMAWWCIAVGSLGAGIQLADWVLIAGRMWRTK